jgi:hypothetical protein
MHIYDPPYAHNDVKHSNIVLITRCKGQAPVATLMYLGSARPSRKEIRSHRGVTVGSLSMLASEFFIVLKDVCLHSQIVKRSQMHITPACVGPQE